MLLAGYVLSSSRQCVLVYVKLLYISVKYLNLSTPICIIYYLYSFFLLYSIMLSKFCNERNYSEQPDSLRQRILSLGKYGWGGMEGGGGGVGPLIWYSCIDRKLDVIFYFVMHDIESLDMRQLHRKCLAL